MNELNPGIRRTVAWLQSISFRTVDSGDGETHDFECDRDCPYVVIQVDPEMIVAESRRVCEALRAAGVVVDAIGESVCIQATYDPVTDTAFIDIMGVSDHMIGGQDETG